LHEGEDALFRFTITDVSNGAAVLKAHPAAWLAPRVKADRREALDAAKVISRFLRGDRFSRPALDLNVFYALSMNDDATVTIVDPLFGFGNTKLLAMIQLKGDPVDWALTEDQSRLYISTPSSDRVTVVETASWSELAAISSIGRPNRLALQPDEQYLWVACEDPAASGVAVIATEGSGLVKRIPTGRGPREIAFDGRGRYAFVTNREEGTVSAVETSSLTKLTDLTTGPAPASIAYSLASQMIYVADAVSGLITIISPESLSIVGRAQAAPGLSQLRFSPDGKIGLIVNPKANAVHVLDAALGRIVHTIDTDKSPDQVIFAGTLAYIRHLDSATVRIIPLVGLGAEGSPVSVIDFPAGQNSPSARKPVPSLAAPIAAAPGEDAVLVANPSDRTIYYYKQGMAAPLGSFSNYGRMPRAVITIDRSLRERRPGVYETIGRLGQAGDYNLAFLLDTPRITHFFDVKISPNPQSAERAASSVVVTALESPVPEAGKPAQIRFRMTTGAEGTPATALGDVTVLAFSPGGWQRRIPANAAPESPGVYSVQWTPPRSGSYYFYAEAPSAGTRFNQNWFLTVEAKESSR
jgi:DNA-binding beta-propeller fold protein YncE